MKLSFMTWVCPDWDRERLVEFTSESAYDGVELRVDEDHRHGLDSSSSAADRAAAVELFDEHGVDIPAVATSEFLAHSDPEVRAEQVARAKANAELAGDLGADVLRLFAKGDRDELAGDAVTDCAAALTEVCEFAADHGVTPLLETRHDIVTTPEEALAVLERVESDNVGLLWNRGWIDDDAFAAVGDQLRHVHVHKEVLDPEFEGIVDLMERLDSVGFEGAISLEIIRGDDLREGLPTDEIRETGERLRRHLESV